MRPRLPTRYQSPDPPRRCSRARLDPRANNDSPLTEQIDAHKARPLFKMPKCIDLPVDLSKRLSRRPEYKGCPDIWMAGERNLIGGGKGS